MRRPTGPPPRQIRRADGSTPRHRRHLQKRIRRGFRIDSSLKKIDMRTKFIAGNWKMNLTKTSSIELARAIARAIPNNVEVGIAPPFVYIDAVASVISGSKLLLGAQDAYCETGGAYTGEICVPMLKDLGVRFCLSGHSERRHVLHETPDL